MKDDLGVSLLLVNTDRGLELVENSNIDKTPVSIDEATPKNPMLLHPSVCNRDKDQPWKILYESGYADMLRKCQFMRSPVRKAGSVLKNMLKVGLGRKGH